MTTSTRIGLAGILACVLLALVLLASGLSGLEFSPGLPFMPGDAGSDSIFSAIFRATLYLLALSPIIFILASLLISAADQRKQLIKRVLIIGGLTLVAFAIFQLPYRNPPVAIPSRAELPQATRIIEDPRLLPTPRPYASNLAVSGARPPAPPLQPVTLPDWLVSVVATLLIGAIVTAIWRYWPRPGAPVAEPPSGEQLVAQQAKDALAGIKAGGDVRKTVVQCYLEMSSILSDSRGVRRGQAMTVRDFERRLAEVGIADTHVRRLTRLFERARYGAATSDQRDKDEALACLTAIVQAYGGRP